MFVIFYFIENNLTQKFMPFKISRWWTKHVIKKLPSYKSYRVIRKYILELINSYPCQNLRWDLSSMPKITGISEKAKINLGKFKGIIHRR